MRKNSSFIKSLQQKNHHLLRIIMVTALVLGLFVSGCTPASTAHAAKNTFYASIMNGNKQGVKKMKVVDDKLIIWGCFATSKKADKAYNKYFNGKGSYQKYTFELSRNFKCYATGGLSEPAEYSLEVFKQNYATQPDLGLGLLLKVRNGKLVTLYTES